MTNNNIQQAQQAQQTQQVVQPSKFIEEDIQQTQQTQQTQQNQQVQNNEVKENKEKRIDLKKLSLYGKLALIQNELKVPKNQVNNFGHYNFRSCEDILEASKKVCKKYYTTLVVYDEIEVFANRFYVKAIAELHDWFSDNVIKTHAYAREADSKTGMDLAQVTGASSSYARKYALNGLFNIDDEKDPDTNEYRQNQNRNSQNNKNYQKGQKNYNQNGYNQNMQVQNQPRNAQSVQNNQNKANTQNSQNSQNSQNNQNNQKVKVDPTKVVNETKALLQACTNLQINLNSESMIRTIDKYNNGKHDPNQMNVNDLVTYNATLKKIIELKNQQTNTVEKVEDIKNIQNNQNNQNRQQSQQSSQNSQSNQAQAIQPTQQVTPVKDVRP